MQYQPRSRPRTARLELIEEEDKGRSPSYFEWQEQTVRTRAYTPASKPEPKVNSIIRLFRRFT